MYVGMWLCRHVVRMVRFGMVWDGLGWYGVFYMATTDISDPTDQTGRLAVNKKEKHTKTRRNYNEHIMQ